ncbi:MAG: Zn-dependent alcohol dehydrogenase [Deltaproteobacteria bacterium]|nr:Zn-dependent alcohol dehydrogenase [Myxococcales bacterium]TDJ10446.1 MAG: Zn-dependent alcohol dehydrogenase [Deltaproteobacteria bacterium]TDJ18810.1 MAG: Zn-dependent alcohol dehydrogenase [Deltaproteobacteria bacterium]
MRAAVLEAVGQPLAIYDDVEIADPNPGFVKVKVVNCGICHSDLSITEGKFPAATPIILGHEAAGIVEEVGEGVTSVAPGDHVVLSPAPPCGSCYWCIRGDASQCVNTQGIATNALPDGTTGLSRKGQVIGRGVNLAAFAEYVVCQATGAVKIPQQVPLDVACVIGCAVQTGVGAVLNTANVEAGATVLIMGLGGIGLSAVQGAVIAGASRIIVSDPVAERGEAAKAFGATDCLDPTSDDVVSCVREITNGIGVDYAFETAGLAALVPMGVAAIRNGGTCVAVGAPPLDQNIDLGLASLFVISGKKLMGTLLGSCHSLHEIPRLISLWQAGRLDLESLITGRRPLEEINEGMEDLQASRGIRTVLTL